MIRLANRRFVPFYFDLSNRGAVGDKDARKFVVAKRKNLGGNGVPTPPVLFMSPDGEILGEASNYASTKKILKTMLRVLEENEKYNQPSETEKKTESALDRANIRIDLQDFDGARKILKEENGDAERYLLGRLARFDADWDAMEKRFEGIEDKALVDDIRMERAHRLWAGSDYEKLAEHLKDFPKESNRYSEARYYEGLAKYHEGEKKDALKIWSATIRGCDQDRWIYRADWAYTTVKQGAGGSFSSAGPRSSCLNRIGYMGRSNPDLRKSRK